MAQALNASEREELERLRAEQAKKNTISYKVSEKGACSVYGLGRFPVTLYKEQWQRLLAEDQVAELKKFLKANDKQLKAKE